jgi:nucleotide-binding universal stress UspA family protein
MVDRIDPLPPFRVLVAIDFSDASAATLRRGLTEANRNERGHVHLVNVTSEETERSLGSSLEAAAVVEERLRALAAEELDDLAGHHPPLRIERIVTHAMSGEPSEEIVWLAEGIEANLLVVGAHDAARGDGVVERILRTSGCPVLVTPSAPHGQGGEASCTCCGGPLAVAGDVDHHHEASKHLRCTKCAALHRMIPGGGVERVMLRRPPSVPPPVQAASAIPPATSSIHPTTTDLHDDALANMPLPPPPVSLRRARRTRIAVATAVAGMIPLAAIAMSLTEGPPPRPMVPPYAGAAAEEVAALGSPESPISEVRSAPVGRPAATTRSRPLLSISPPVISTSPSRVPEPTSSDVAPTEGDPAAGPPLAPEETVLAPPVATIESPPELPGLDEGALRSSMNAALERAALCADPDGPHGRGRILVTFAPSGRATRAVITEPPFAGTAVGSCVARAFRGVEVPPFSGGYVNVQRPFHVR